ncbi:V-type ATP synthase subunit D [Caldivirga maquilingensis]|uniref:V-type ATPase, D subunit n=1 Tax=Caldivirga maquilingensis (strain ATCC 700844 / DSM 13496 / JCM 10307 / IC-167) TaxID=397948 RepID=A8MAM3_CALMQ|nr:V-type ATP synthase subunit D [Caldivirga maquilingensis]ABW01059.1 V-type ATPase, D subunit [Caldivirga maquilingensis IC-167]
MSISALQRPTPSRLMLIRLRTQETLYRRIRKTVEDARNATLQRLRALVPTLEERRKLSYGEISKVAELYQMAKNRIGAAALSVMASSTKIRVDGYVEDRVIGGLKFGILNVKGFGGPTYGIYSIPAELDSSLTSLVSILPMLMEYVNLENIFYTLLYRVREYQRMINAIDNVILPRIRDSIAFIRLALDEMEREDFVRRVIINRIIGTE